MSRLWNDLRTAVRTLIKNPGFTAIVVVALALGLGVNIAVFDAVNGLLIRPLAVHRPDRLTTIVMGARNQPNRWARLSYPNYLEVRGEQQVFSAVLASTYDSFALVTGQGEGGLRDHPENLFGEFVSENYFETLGVNASMGRLFTREENSSPAADPVVILSDRLWRRRFGSDPHIIGRRIYLNVFPFTVVGVMGRRFGGITGSPLSDYWLPLARRQVVYGPEDDMLTNRARKQLRVLGRLRDGVTLEQAHTRMKVMGETLARDYPANANMEVAVISEVAGRFGPIYAPMRTSSMMALLVAGLVLLISCANVANLLLARGQKRTRELSIRLALGAGRGGIVRQMMVESLLLALIGGALGGLVALWFGELLQAVLPPNPLDLGFRFDPDARTMAWAVGASLLAGLAFGAVPAWRASRASLSVALKTDLRTEGHRLRRAGLRQALVIAQIATSVVVMACGGLFLRSLKKVEAIDPGFRTENLVSGLIDPGLFRNEPAENDRFYRELLQRLERRPGVRAASMSLYMPLINIAAGVGPLIKDGDAPPPPNESALTYYSVVSAGYFETMEAPLLLGRDFTEAERQGGAPVVIINRELAHRLYGRPEDAIGRRFRIGALDTDLLQIIGVARDGKYISLLEDPRPWFYMASVRPELHDSNTMRTILLRARSARDVPGVVTALRAEVESMDPRLPVDEVFTAQNHLSMSLFGARMAAGLGGILALLALGLATMGIYSVMTYTVSQRTREIGIRMALGGQVRDVLGLVVGQGLALVLVGVIAGGLVAAGITRLLEGLLYGVSASDPITFAATVALLVAVALVATLLPARRAAKVDPMIALRYD
jgi:predicted permease